MSRIMLVGQVSRNQRAVKKASQFKKVDKQCLKVMKTTKQTPADLILFQNISDFKIETLKKMMTIVIS